MSLFSRKTYTFKYSLFGIAFGFCFPVFSLIFDGLFLKDLSFSAESFFAVHHLNPLHFIIDSAPIFLGIAFGFAGRNMDEVTEVRQDIESYNEELLQQNQIVTQYSHELQAQSDKIKDQRREVEKLFSDVQASVRTAERLQLALLPAFSHLKSSFEEIFVFYKAKDIVSGDFYWFRNVIVKNKNFKIVVVADCTGHGVPGAIMTIVGYFLLERIVEKEKIIKPNEILKALNLGITQAFSSKDNTKMVREGMDASVLIINETDKEIYYAGANRPLYYKKPTHTSIQILKGSRAALGGENRKGEKNFDLHTLEYISKTQFYLFSDGYTDQFGGEKDKKYGSKRFRELLNQNQNESMSEIHTQVKTSFEDWKNKTSQTDDIIVVGIKIK